MDLCKDPDNSPSSYIKLECALYIFHQFSARNSRCAKEYAGVFISTGQPDDFNPELVERKKKFFTILDSAQERINEYVSTIPITLKAEKSKMTSESTPEERKEYQNVSRNIRESKGACANIRELVELLKQNRPSFVGPDSSFWLSWRAQNKKKVEEKKVGKGQQQQKSHSAKKSTPNGRQSNRDCDDSLPKRRARDPSRDQRSNKKTKTQRSSSNPGDGRSGNRSTQQSQKSSSKNPNRRVVVVKNRK